MKKNANVTRTPKRPAAVPRLLRAEVVAFQKETESIHRARLNAREYLSRLLEARQAGREWEVHLFRRLANTQNPEDIASEVGRYWALTTKVHRKLQDARVLIEAIDCREREHAKREVELFEQLAGTSRRGRAARQPAALEVAP